jgi:hypothetical protein
LRAENSTRRKKKVALAIIKGEKRKEEKEGSMSGMDFSIKLKPIE